MANKARLVCGHVLGRISGTGGDELEVIAGRDVDHGAADALHAGIAVVALLKRCRTPLLSWIQRWR
jgi:hypothetical protein